MKNKFKKLSNIKHTNFSRKVRRGVVQIVVTVALIILGLGGLALIARELTKNTNTNTSEVVYSVSETDKTKVCQLGNDSPTQLNRTFIFDSNKVTTVATPLVAFPANNTTVTTKFEYEIGGGGSAFLPAYGKSITKVEMRVVLTGGTPVKFSQKEIVRGNKLIIEIAATDTTANVITFSNLTSATTADDFKDFNFATVKDNNGAFCTHVYK